ncbi:hypothetical protein GALMADRAFT_56102 [Galerina marginata CBS 339.88]|uniref:FAD-binding FR-type domain-containing protein n=1 Tax=Galerina marginata (strain CBS 339.88) TaxID=685588 RepID=A0A067TM40_GALM3|nr:hypothetical protein GALMADRAFT_56102 [Galerina marginata CBS 339.88]
MDLASGKRVLTIVVSFCAGFSIYFFLEDPIPHHAKASLSSRQFISSKIISSEESGPSTKLITIAIPPHLLPSENPPNDFDPIWSVYIKDDDIQVERPYTPLNGLDNSGHMSFWIKKYPKGEVGRWIHTKSPGDGIEIRGPLKTWPWKEDALEEIVMISGGTGITPFVQLFNKVISKATPTSTTRFTLLHSSRVPQELPPALLLEPLLTFSAENPDKFKFQVFVDEDDGSKAPVSIPQINTGRITESALEQHLDLKPKRPSWWSRLWRKEAPKDDASRRILFLVCGPEPMISAIAGPFGRNLSQGPVGGILEKMGYTSSQVYKL